MTIVATILGKPQRRLNAPRYRRLSLDGVLSRPPAQVPVDAIDDQARLINPISPSNTMAPIIA